MGNTAANVGLLAVSIGAIDKGITLVQTNLVAGIVVLVVALVVLGVYEKYPSTPSV
jgi:hypothetical protein